MARELTIEEGLQHRTYQDAIAGSRAARHQILKMITERERWLQARSPSPPAGELRMEFEPDNADEAMLILGIAEPDRREPDALEGRLLLQPWAVEAALSRPGRPPLSGDDAGSIRRCTRDGQQLRFPSRRARKDRG